MIKTFTACIAMAAIVLAPCAWDTDPHELVGAADIIARLARMQHSPPERVSQQGGAPGNMR